MALATMPQQSSTSNLLDLVTLLGKGNELFSGKSQTTTTNSSISQEGMNAMLKSILESTNGLAQVTSGQKAAGLYNSSSNTLLANDLLARSASEVAQQNRTTTSTTKAPAPMKGSSLAGVLGAASLISTIFGGSGTGKKNSGFGGIFDSVFGGSSTSSSDSSSSSLFGGLFGGGSSGGSSLTDSGTSSYLGEFGSALGAAGTAYSAYDMAKNDNWGGAVGTGAGYYLGGPIGGAIGGAIGTAADTYLGPVVQDVWKGAGDIVTDVVGGIGDALGGITKGCFITTAVCEKYGFPDDCEILQILRKYRDEFMLPNPEYAPFVKQYYEEAPTVVQAIKSRPHYQQHLIWTKCYEEYIIPAVKEIEQGNNESAFNIYKEMFDWLYSFVFVDCGVEHNA